ncbi:citryl-CoA lyase [Pelomonas sp. P7]|uniref:Citryl-CoA lyase n=1 Tax=Pelomonas caseinilytica TaxID=2906763 RepID=A0ABS8XCK8_9BURK|nr:citryl-CoA lyase [Pelomonas sp. P7]MCE4536658.1 citryl-CoA lyase [Pelomonas sp. P7]
MTAAAPRGQVRTRIWQEVAEPDNAFATQRALCHGYDVYGDMLGQARWVDMLYLLLRGEAPGAPAAQLLEALAVALANPGPRDAAVHAAMCAGVGGSTSASALIAALSVGAGRSGGAREVWAAMQLFQACGRSPAAWERALAAPAEERAGIWPQAEHPPGFDAHATGSCGIVRRTLAVLASLGDWPVLAWLQHSREPLEQAAGRGLSMAGVAAAALVDLGFTPEQGEMLHLLLRLPGAAAHALEQGALGHKAFPFFALDLQDDPGAPS